jgi:hypothetical protein
MRSVSTSPSRNSFGRGRAANENTLDAHGSRDDAVFGAITFVLVDGRARRGAR